MKRGFSLLELMTVVAIVGILASIAVPNLTAMASHYRGIEDARSVLGAVGAARGLSQRNNKPVELAIFSDHAELRTPASLTGTTEDTRRVIGSFTTVRSISFGKARATNLKFFSGSTTTSTVTVGTADAIVRFCAGTDAYYRVVVSGVQTPVCGTGNLASANVRVNFNSANDLYHVELKAPLGSIELKSGAAP